MSGMGIRVYLYAYACPTPQLSFSVRFRNALAGVVVTASHNPKEYNGYKVYDEFGCQLVPQQAKQVISYVDSITDYHTIDFTGDDSIIGMVDETDSFIGAIMKQSRYHSQEAKADLKVVYTPLHGTAQATFRYRKHLSGMDLHLFMWLRNRLFQTVAFQRLNPRIPKMAGRWSMASDRQKGGVRISSLEPILIPTVWALQ